MAEGRGGDDDSGIDGEEEDADYSKEDREQDPATVGFDRISIDLYNKSSQQKDQIKPAKGKLIVEDELDHTGLNNLVSTFISNKLHFDPIFYFHEQEDLVGFDSPDRVYRPDTRIPDSSAKKPINVNSDKMDAGMQPVPRSILGPCSFEDCEEFAFSRCFWKN